MPVWGFADVVASEAEGVPEGTRIFGYLPPASHLVVQPDRSDPATSSTRRPHRAKLPAAYNRYIRVAALPFYEEENEDQQMLLWPLYFTSFLIDDFLDDESMFGAKTAVLSSASSRTSSALAYLLARRDGIEVIGLTSPGNVEFTESLGVYDRVVPYEEIDSLEAEAGRLRRHVGRRQGPQRGPWPLRGRAAAPAGRRHHPPRGSRRRLRDLAGPKPVFFFAPDRLRKRTEDWGPDGLNERLAESLGAVRRVDPRLAAGRARLRARRTSSASIASCSTASPTQRSGTYSLDRSATFLIVACFLAAARRGLRLLIGRRGRRPSNSAAITSPPATRRRAATQGKPALASRLLPAQPGPGRTARSQPRPFKASNGADELPLRVHRRRSEASSYMLDSAPQAYARMEREQVEFWQNVEWSHKAARAAPRPMTSLGLGGYWFPLQSRLLTTDGVRLITIKMRSSGSSGPAARKSIATRAGAHLSRAAVKPPGYS